MTREIDEKQIAEAFNNALTKLCGGDDAEPDEPIVPISALLAACAGIVNAYIAEVPQPQRTFLLMQFVALIREQMIALNVEPLTYSSH
jgi:hypothetical protein